MKRIAVVLLAVALVGCRGKSESPSPAQPGSPAASSAAQPGDVPLPAIDGQVILERIKVLSSDEYEGRAPGTKGEELTVKYLEEEFKKLGLKPGNTDGTYIQKVPAVGITGTNSQPLTV